MWVVESVRFIDFGDVQIALQFCSGVLVLFLFDCALQLFDESRRLFAFCKAAISNFSFEEIPATICRKNLPKNLTM